MTSRKTGMGSHQPKVMVSDEHLTPKYITDALGPFDLDPCASIVRPWDIAPVSYTVLDDGDTLPWFGRVWCNPPYGKHLSTWLKLCADHGNAIALTFARTETAVFFSQVWDRADAVLFLEGRITFCDIHGNPEKFNGGAPSVLIAYGQECYEVLLTCGLRGKFIGLK